VYVPHKGRINAPVNIHTKILLEVKLIIKKLEFVLAKHENVLIYI
jgi:hypothetical protein